MLVLDRWRLLNAGVGPEITVSGRYLLGLHLLSHCIFSYLAHALPLLRLVMPELRRRGLAPGPVILAEQARVALGDLFLDARQVHQHDIV